VSVNNVDSVDSVDKPTEGNAKCCPSLKRNAPEADFDGLNFGSFDVGTDVDGEEFEWSDDAVIVYSDHPNKCTRYDESNQYHDVLLSTAAPVVSDSNLDTAPAAATNATTHVDPATSNSAAEERAPKIMEQKKKKKFKGKSDEEMGKISNVNMKWITIHQVMQNLCLLHLWK
jgi:hypothetical protein